MWHRAAFCPSCGHSTVGAETTGERAGGIKDDGSPPTLARSYWDWFQQRGPVPGGPADVQEAVRRGDALLGATGHWAEAVRVARRAWIEVHGDHLEGVHGDAFTPYLTLIHLEYQRRNAPEGVRARSYLPPGPRVHCRPHASAREHLQE